jgi:hypothetical protein
MNKKLSFPTGMAVLCLVLCLCSISNAQSDLSIEELRSQIAVMSGIERDPNTVLEVKKINHELLVTRQAQLWTRLEKTIEAMRQYRTTVQTQLSVTELTKLDKSIESLDAELQSLRGIQAGPVDPAPATVAAAASRPDSLALTSELLAAATPCPANPDEIISAVHIAPGAPGTGGNLFFELAVPLSKTQSPPITTTAGGQISIPQALVQITTQSGATSHLLATTAYGPARTISGFGPKFLKVQLTSPLQAGDTDVRAALLNVTFACGNGTGNGSTLIASTSQSGKIFDVNAYNDKTAKDYDEAVKAAKSPDRKAFSAGFAAAKGDGEKAEGASDLLINKTFSPSDLQGTLFDFFDLANLSFQVKKSTAEKADPRYLNLGLNLRKTFLVFLPKRPDTLTIDDGAKSEEIENAISNINDQVKKSRNKGFFRVLSVGGGLKLEGEAFDFKTVNFVSDPTIELGSIAKRIGSKGFYNFSILGGAELGRNLSKPTNGTASSAALDEVSWIARMMGGGQFTLRYLPTDETGSHWAVELNLAYVNRHLFKKEVFTEAAESGTAPKITSIGEGNRAWRQADLKLFLFGDQKARYGFKVTYMNGSLPPAFTPTKGFQYGFVVESTDGDPKPANP